MEAHLSSPTDISGCLEARNLLAHQVPPENVTWTTDPVDRGVIQTEAASVDGARSRNVVRAASSIVPASFVRLCEYVVQHRDPDRFALLYRLLWRLVHEPDLRHDAGDADMARAQHMAHAVRRDIHKLKANLKFREVVDPAHGGEPVSLAWCEPAHHILETVAPWLAKRHPDIRWALMMPDRSAYWDREKLVYAPGGGRPLSVTAPDDEWLARFHAQFAAAQPVA